VKTAVCLIVRNEARDIQEWIAFHALAGFDTQIIFDNGSSDGTADLIQQAAGNYDIRFHNWTNRTASSQVGAYQAACEAYKLEFDWIAFIDSDEFLVTANGQKINEFLTRYENYAAIAINWAVYGADGHEHWPPGLVVESFRRRADETFFPARHVKSILRPHLAMSCLNPHYFDMRPHAAGTYCDTHGNPMEWFAAPEAPGGLMRGVGAALPDYSVARINHYFTRSRAHFRAKVQRGYPANVAIRKLDEFDEYDRNEVADPAATREIEALREAVAHLRGPAGAPPHGRRRRLNRP
jgi:glycosyltransferase involved in cell wall biosynthesis